MVLLGEFSDRYPNWIKYSKVETRRKERGNGNCSDQMNKFIFRYSQLSPLQSFIELLSDLYKALDGAGPWTKTFCQRPSFLKVSILKWMTYTLF